MRYWLACLVTLALAGCDEDLVFPPPLPEGNVLKLTTSEGGAIDVVGASASLGQCSKYEFASDCFRFAGGDVATLTPVPEPGFVFDGFTGACTGTTDCMLPMSGSKAVTARFIHADYDFAAVMPAIEQYLQSHRQFAGAAVAIVHKDKGVVFENVTGNQIFDTVALAASASKVPAAGILMTLMDEGYIKPNTPISDYTYWKPVIPGMTIEHTLSNTSGMPGLLSHSGDLGIYTPHVCTFLKFGDFKHCAEWVFSTDFGKDYVAPGTVFNYGGGQWQIAGAVAERNTRTAWRHLVRTRLSEPCDLSILRFGLNDTREWTGHPDSLVETKNPYIEAGAIGNLRDFEKILLLHLNKGECNGQQVISPERVAEMQVDRGTPAGKHPTARLGSSGHWGFPSGYGMGWWIKLNEDGSDPTIFYDAGAYGSLVLMDIERDYGIYVQLEDYRFPPDPDDGEIGIEDLINLMLPILEAQFPVTNPID